VAEPSCAGLLAHEVFDEAGEPGGGILPGDAACGLCRVCQHVRRLQQIHDAFCKHGWSQIALCDDDSAGHFLQRRRVRRLMIVDGMRQRHQDRGAPGHRDFRNAGCACPGDDQMGRGKMLGDIREERRQFGGDASRGIGGADTLQILGAALLNEPKAGA
jgi:hypothetical protein